MTTIGLDSAAVDDFFTRLDPVPQHFLSSSGMGSIGEGGSDSGGRGV
jgi:hypothetical protein